MKKMGPNGTRLRDYLQSEMKDPEFRRLYEAAGVELQVALEITQAREAANMSQNQLAAAIKTKQQTVSRLEQGEQNVTIGTLARIAHALNKKLEVRLTDRVPTFRGASKDRGLTASLVRDRRKGKSYTAKPKR